MYQQDGIRKMPSPCRAQGHVDYLPPWGQGERGGRERRCHGTLGLPAVLVGRAIAMGIWTLEKPHAALFRPNAAPRSLPSVHASVVYRAWEPVPDPLGTHNQVYADEPHATSDIN